jgi:hypothetical protein
MGNTITYTVDFASIIATLAWSIILLIVLFSKRVNGLVESLLNRITKIEFAGVTLDLPVAKSYLPDEGKSAQEIEFWHKAPSVMVNDSYATTFFDQLNEAGVADYAVIDLGIGQSWLTSRLFIISILYPQIKGIKAFVFVENVNGIRKKYLGWTSADKIHWILAKNYPWMEEALHEAYSSVLKNSNKVIANNGRIGNPYDSSAIQGSIHLLREFLQRVQSQTYAIPNEWVSLNSSPDLYEHANWVNGQLLEQMASGNLQTDYLRSDVLRTKPTNMQNSLIAAMTGCFSAVIDDQCRFEYLIDRRLLLEKYAIQTLLNTGSVPRANAL